MKRAIRFGLVDSFNYIDSLENIYMEGRGLRDSGRRGRHPSRMDNVRRRSIQIRG